MIWNRWQLDNYYFKSENEVNESNMRGDITDKESTGRKVTKSDKDKKNEILGKTNILPLKKGRHNNNELFFWRTMTDSGFGMETLFFIKK